MNLKRESVAFYFLNYSVRKKVLSAGYSFLQKYKIIFARENNSKRTSRDYNDNGSMLKRVAHARYSRKTRARHPLKLKRARIDHKL